MKLYVYFLLIFLCVNSAWANQIKMQSFVIKSKEFSPLYLHKVTPQDTYSFQSKDKKTLVNIDLQNISFLKKPYTCEEQFKVLSKHLNQQGTKDVNFSKKNVMKNSVCQISYRRNGQSVLQNIFVNTEKKEQLTLTAVSQLELPQLSSVKSQFEVSYAR